MPARIAPLALTIIGALSVAGIILLAALREPIPDTLTTLATVSLSALAGALVMPSMPDVGGRGPAPSSPAPAAALRMVPPNPPVDAIEMPEPPAAAFVRPGVAGTAQPAAA